MKVEDRARILKGIATARAWLDELLTGAIASTELLAAREGLSERSIRNTLALALRSPTVIEAIIAGRLPRGIGITRLAEFAPSWSGQQTTIGMLGCTAPPQERAGRA